MHRHIKRQHYIPKMLQVLFQLMKRLRQLIVQNRDKVLKEKLWQDPDSKCEMKEIHEDLLPLLVLDS